MGWGWVGWCGGGGVGVWWGCSGVVGVGWGNWGWGGGVWGGVVGVGVGGVGEKGEEGDKKPPVTANQRPSSVSSCQRNELSAKACHVVVFPAQSAAKGAVHGIEIGGRCEAACGSR